MKLPDLALIHGWGLGCTVWESTLPALAQRCRVHLVDLPGYGTAAPDPAGFMQSAVQLTDSLPAGTTLCGWSLGGMLALQAALLKAQRIRGLVLVGSTPSFTQRDNWPDAQAPALLDAFVVAAAENPQATLQRFIALLNQGDTLARALGRRMIRQSLAGTPPDTATLVQGLSWLRDVDLREQVASISVPALLIHGEHDPLVPLTAAHWLHEQLPDSQLELFSDSAHAPFLNDPLRFAELVGNFCHASAINQTTRP